MIPQVLQHSTERSADIVSPLRLAGPAATAPKDNGLQLLNMTGCALIVVLDSDGQMIRIPPASKTPPLAPPATTRLTLSVAPDVSSSPRALWLPVNGIPILPPQASIFDLAAAARDYSDDATAAAAALSRIVAFPSRKESAFVVVLCSGVQVENPKP